MTVSIPAFVLPAESIEAIAGPVENISLKQSDAGLASAFSPLLVEALAALEGQFPGAAAPQAGIQPPFQSPQSLPQGGKLLPLLDQLLAGAEAQGVDAGHVLEQLEARLESLEETTTLSPQQALGVALLEVADAHPDYLSSPRAELPAVYPELSNLLRQLGIQETGKPVESALPERLTQEPKWPLLDRVVGQLQQPSQQQTQLPQQTLMQPQLLAQGQPPAEFIPALTAFKQLAAAVKTASPELSVKTEGLAAASPLQPLTAIAESNPGALPSVTVKAPLGQANWDQALSERVQWLLSQGTQRAQIRLNPAHLGPMEIRIQVQNDQANVQFTSAHAPVREAVEAALPRLREMLGASGVELVDVDVSSGQSFAEQQRTGEQAVTHAWGGAAAGDEGEAEQTVHETSVAAVLETGRLDLFA